MYKTVRGKVSKIKQKYTQSVPYKEVSIKVHPIFFWKNIKTKLFPTDSVDVSLGDNVIVMYSDVKGKPVTAIKVLHD